MRCIDADALEPDADYYEGDYWAVSIVQIHNAPTIEPQRTGRWIDAQYPYSKCSICGEELDTLSYEANYCPNCGARMEEGE